jgi:putative membrane protein
MTQRSLDRYKALLLILMAMFLTEKFVSGKLYYYIGPRFIWLALVAVALLILLAGAFNLVSKKAGDDEQGAPYHHEGAEHSHDKASIWPVIIVALPLALGVIIPARPLGANAVSTKGMLTDVAFDGGSGSTNTAVIASERNILDWVRVINQLSDPAALDGQDADVVGFVYRDPRFAQNQFMVGRFTLTCCVADALAIGIIVQSEQAASLVQDSWVRITGTFKAGDAAGQELPVLIADEIVPVQEPDQPYLYP